MKALEIVLNEERNVTLTAYIQAVGGEFSNIEKRPAVLVLPGGGYEFCSDREADPVALSYSKAGFQTFVLRYSVNVNKKWPNPLNDYEQAMEYIKSKAQEWAVDVNKIAVIGFSAGGHLAGCAATVAKNKPAAAILGYAVLSASTTKLYNDEVDVIKSVDKNTCPCFLFSSRTDETVPVSNSLKMMAALEENGVPFEAHIYSFGPHGFSVADKTVNAHDIPMCSRVPNWVPDSVAWLNEMFN